MRKYIQNRPYRTCCKHSRPSPYYYQPGTERYSAPSPYRLPSLPRPLPPETRTEGLAGKRNNARKNERGSLQFYSFLFYPITLEGRRGTTDEFATTPFHLDLFSAALVELAKSIPVHSLILSSHLFFCLPLFLFPFTVPCSIVFAKPETLRHGQTILAFVS